MPVPTSTQTLYATLVNIQSVHQQLKNQAQSALSKMQGGNIDTQYVFNFLDQMKGLIITINGWLAVPNLNAYATSNWPGYVGTLTNDLTAVKNAGQACIDWVVTNFPKDSTNTYLLGETLNADGSRTNRQFTSVQTGGLQTLLQTFIATIG